MSLPKVLIINQPFNDHTGGGITLTNLFSGWGKNKIAVVCQNYLLQDFNTQICENYYQLGHKENRMLFPLSSLRNKHPSGPINLTEKMYSENKMKASKVRFKIIMNYFYPVLRFFGVYNFISNTQLSTDLCTWLKKLNPDILYAQATNTDSLNFIALVHSYLQKPLIFHMMDDWPSVVRKGFLGHREQKKNDVAFRAILKRTDILMCISEDMVNEYWRRYHKSSLAFHNTIDADFWSRSPKKTYELNSQPSILYAGRIGLGIGRSLELVAKALQRINGEFDVQVRFILQTREKPTWSTKYDFIVHREFAKYEQLPDTFSQADFLILPYDFSKQSVQYIGYSMPTKAPEYMISGTPIVVLAPKETAIVKYAVKSNWAKVVTENKVDAVYETIKALMNNIEERELIGRTARELALKKHVSSKVRSHFKKVICSLNDNNNYAE